MNKVYTIFSELLKLCPRYQFDKAVEQYNGDRYVKTFTTWQQFMAILYSQITQKDSLRDIETGLSAHAAQWYHLGLSGIHKARYLMPMPSETIRYLKDCSIIF